MELKNFFTDDDAVSPVIGVILMVAITVILAAVIASFVLGLGQSTGDSTPTITFEADYSASDGELTVSASQVGDSVDAKDIHFKGGDGTNSVAVDFSGATLSGSTNGVGVSANIGADDSIEAGDQIVLGQSGGTTLGSSYDIDIIWNPGDGDSSTLRTLTGPDA